MQNTSIFPVTFENYFKTLHPNQPENNLSINKLKDELFSLKLNKSPAYDEINFNVIKNVLALCINHYSICGALRDLAPFEQFKKREEYPWRSVNFSTVAGLKSATLLNLTLLHGCFSRFLNCTNGTKLRNASHLFNQSLQNGFFHMR